MELVRFYACAGDPVAVAGRLVAKASERAEPLVVTGSADLLDQLSKALWGAPGFLVHAGPDASEAVRRRSRIRLQTELPPEVVPLLLNLEAPLDVEALRAERLFDVFGAEGRPQARERFRRCQQAGWRTETVQVAA